MLTISSFLRSLLQAKPEGHLLQNDSGRLSYKKIFLLNSIFKIVISYLLDLYTMFCNEIENWKLNTGKGRNSLFNVFSIARKWAFDFSSEGKPCAIKEWSLNFLTTNFSNVGNWYVKRTGRDLNTPVQSGPCEIVECRTDVTFWRVDCDHFSSLEDMWSVERVIRGSSDSSLQWRHFRNKSASNEAARYSNDICSVDRSFRRRFLWLKFTPVASAPNFHCGVSLKLSLSKDN